MHKHCVLQAASCTIWESPSSKMASTQRQYEIVVLGATGYTGKYTAEHIATSLPTDLKWAIAGRSEPKLKQLLPDLRVLNADRLEPSIEIATLQKEDLVNLAKRTKVLITTIGPYHKYGSPVFEACAETGTHYLDVTGEVPWVYDMVRKYDATAKRSGSIMIPQNGIESAPTDLMCWMLASHIRSTLGVGTGEIVHSIHDMKATASGGTLSTVLTLLDAYSLTDVAKAQSPWALCPVPPPKSAGHRPLMEKLTGIRQVSDLGTLTDSIQGPADIPIVGRSWGLHDQGRFYGPNFHLSAYMKARNYITSFAFHMALTVGFIALALPPVRWLMKNFVYQPGEGPTKEYVALHRLVFPVLTRRQASERRIRGVARDRQRGCVRSQRSQESIRQNAMAR